jgi:hypothetical protein
MSKDFRLHHSGPTTGISKRSIISCQLVKIGSSCLKNFRRIEPLHLLPVGKDQFILPEKLSPEELEPLHNLLPVGKDQFLLPEKLSPEELEPLHNLLPVGKDQFLLPEKLSPEELEPLHNLLPVGKDQFILLKNSFTSVKHWQAVIIDHFHEPFSNGITGLFIALQDCRI